MKDNFLARLLPRKPVKIASSHNYAEDVECKTAEQNDLSGIWKLRNYAD